MPENDTVSRLLSCVLSETERDIKARLLASKLEEVDREEERQEEVKAGLKSSLKRLTSEADLFRRQVTTGYETRTVACSVVHDYAVGVVLLVRQDTGETIETRPMRDDERQGALPVD